MTKFIKYIALLLFGCVSLLVSAQKIMNGNAECDGCCFCGTSGNPASINPYIASCNFKILGPNEIGFSHMVRCGMGGAGGISYDTVFPYPNGIKCFSLFHPFSLAYLSDLNKPGISINLALSNHLTIGEKYFLMYYDFTPDTSHNNAHTYITVNQVINHYARLQIYDSLLVGSSINGDTLVDTINISFPGISKWKRHSNFFTATGSSNYITVRNYSVEKGLLGGSFLDHFQLYHLNAITKQTISICPNDSVKIYASNRAKRYEWSKNRVEYVTENIDTILTPKYFISATNVNGDSTNFIYAADTGWYWNITYLSDSTILIDSIYVYYGGVEYNPATNIFVCNSDTFLLNAKYRTLLNPNYLWNTGELLPSIKNNNTGLYWLKTATSTCTYLDTFMVSKKNKILIKLLHDSLICYGTILKLNAFSAFYKYYTWNTGDTSSFINVNNAGKYIVIASDGFCSIADTATITTYLGTAVSLPHDTSFCKGGKCIINATNINYTKYIWNTLDTTASITISKGGLYIVTASNALCTVTDTVQVSTYLPQALHLVHDTVLCLGGSFTIDAKSNAYNTYLWNTGITTSTIKMNKPGKYTVNATDGNCSTKDSVTIALLLLPQIGLPKDTTVCFDELEAILISAPIGFASYRWYPTNETTSSILAKEARNYVVEVTDKNGCINKDTAAIDEECKMRVWIPNAFSPNGDGINDLFILRTSHVSEAELHIFNNWGEEIYATSNALAQGWNGTFNGTYCPTGNYVYLIKCTSKDKQTQQNFKGNITLLR